MAEPLLDPNPYRWTLFPIQYPSVQEFYNVARSMNWEANEIDYGKDIAQWRKLTDGERKFISNILAFFAGSDGIVNENIALNLMREVQLPEVRNFYGFQVSIENVHSEVYSRLIAALIEDPEEQTRLFRGIHTIPAIAKKAAWAQKWLDGTLPFADRLVAFAAVEGIFFSSSFCAIYWLRERNIMSNSVGKSNELICRDETLHRDFAAHLYTSVLRAKSANVRDILREAAEVEKEFVCDSLPVSLIGMDCASMSAYVEFITDNLAKMLNLPAIYGTANPYPWMVKLSMENKTNFFESRVTEYKKSDGKTDFVTDGDF